MRALLDTSLLVAGATSHGGFDVAVSSLSWAELRFGIRKAAIPEERARREARFLRLRSAFGPGIPFDDAAAAAYESVCALVLDEGRQVRGRVIDLMIAATAVAHGAAVLTRNPDDFRGLDSLLEIIEA